MRKGWHVAVTKNRGEEGRERFGNTGKANFRCSVVMPKASDLCVFS